MYTTWPNSPMMTFDLSALYEKEAKKLIIAIRHVFGSGPPDPEDVVHQAFQKLAERPNPDEIRDVEAYLWRITRNLVLKEKSKDNIRTRYDFEVKQLFFPADSCNLTPERVLSARDELKLINNAILAMPTSRRRSFVLYRIQGLRVSSVSKRLGISRQAVMKHIARATLDIQELLADGLK